MVFKIKFSKLSYLVASMPIKDKQPLLAFPYRISIYIEMLDLLKAKLIICLSIITNCNLLSSKEASLVLSYLVDLSSKDNKR